MHQLVQKKNMKGFCRHYHTFVEEAAVAIDATDTNTKLNYTDTCHEFLNSKRSSSVIVTGTTTTTIIIIRIIITTAISGSQ